MDAIHCHVGSVGRIVKRAVYIALGVDMAGSEDVPGMYVGENESAKFCLSIMNGLKNRGVGDILIACVDGPQDSRRQSGRPTPRQKSRSASSAKSGTAQNSFPTRTPKA